MSKSSSHEFETLSPIGKIERGEEIQLKRLPGLSGVERLKFIRRRKQVAGQYRGQTEGMFPPRRNLDALPSPEEKISP